MQSLPAQGTAGAVHTAAAVRVDSGRWPRLGHCSGCCNCTAVLYRHRPCKKKKKNGRNYGINYNIGIRVSVFFADPGPGKNLHADPDPGGIRGRGLGVKGKNDFFF